MTKVKENKSVKVETPVIETPVVEEVPVETPVDEKFLANLKKSENYQILKKEIRAKMKDQKGEAKSKLEAELKAIISEEKQWLKDIAEKLTVVKKDIFTYTVTKRGENAILLEVKTSGYYGKEIRVCGYDVIRRDIRRPQVYMNKPYDAAEVFPSDNSFAYWSFRFLPLADALSAAEKRFNLLETGIDEEAAVEESVEVAPKKEEALKVEAPKAEAKPKKVAVVAGVTLEAATKNPAKNPVKKKK